MKDNSYLKQVDRLLTSLRIFLLVQDTALETLLLPKLMQASVNTQAAFLANRLLFALIRIRPADTTPPPNQIWHWLYESTLFLLTQCNPNDRTLYNLQRTLKLPQSSRFFLFDIPHRNEEFSHIRCDIIPPELINDLESAFLHIVPFNRGPERLSKVLCLFETHHIS